MQFCRNPHDNQTNMSKHFQNLIFTDHALDRLRLRSISQADIYQVVSSPAKVYPARDGNKKFIKTVKDRRLHVIATKVKNEDKWLIVSVWVRGENDPIPWVWQVITLPFKLVWWIIKTIWKTIFNNRIKSK